jgi:prolyl 4-hydroxylase
MSFRFADRSTTFTELHPRGPEIRLLGSYVSEGLCRDVIAAAMPRLAPVEPRDGHGAGGTKATRRSSQAWLMVGENTAVGTMVTAVARVVPCPPEYAERVQIVRYLTGEFYSDHTDCYELDSPAGVESLRAHGPRLVSALVYLNDVRAGGETEFPRLGLRVTPRLGSVLLFDNYRADLVTANDRSVHRGLPVTAGEKWIACIWFHDRTYVPR